MFEPRVPRLIDELLDHVAGATPQRLAVVDGALRQDWGTLRARVDRLAGALQASGVAPGDRVAVLDKNSHRYLELYFALPRIGAVAVPLNYRLSARELGYIIGDSTATTLLYSQDYAATAAEIAPARRICLEDGGYEALLAEGRTPSGVARAGDDVFLQMYTSGTTGRPKGAMLTHDNLIANTLTAQHERAYTPADNYLHACPIYHLADLELFYGVTFAGGGHVILREFDAGKALAAITRERVTVAFLVPAMINHLVEHPDLATSDLTSLRLIVYGGSAIPEARLRTALARLPCQLTQGYGLTETSPVLCILPAADHVTEGPRARRIQSCGRAAHGVEVRVVDAEDQDTVGEAVGEIVARGRNIMKGYWRLPEETATALRGGWFHTGDLGFRDADGYIYIVDRMKDMIVTGGENVYPREIEEVLYAHPAVLEAAVIGVPSAEWGETVKALVVPRPGQSPEPGELIAYCRARLAHYKAPTSVDFITALPRNPSGKVLKRELREPYWAGHGRRVG